MRSSKIFLVVSAALILVLAHTSAWAAMPANQKTVKGAKVEGPRKAREVTVSTPGKASPVRRVTHFVNKIEGGVLYTHGGQYSLANVKVVDLTKDRKDIVNTGTMPKKTAEMTFLNNQLHEVVIRQR